MRLASFNVENLFARARALDPMSPDSTRMLAAFERFNRLAQQPVYGEADKAAMIDDLLTLGVAVALPDGRVVLNRDRDAPLAVLRENRGDFLVVRTATGIEIVATGRADWVGWLELVVAPVDETAVRMTAKVIETLAPDVLAVIEAEARPALVDFNTVMLADRFRHVMVVDGNDRRSIDVGLMTTAPYPIATVRSHVDERDTEHPVATRREQRLFSRDAPVYEVVTGPTSEPLWVIVNHFKSQSWTSGDPGPLRRRQCRRVVDIYRHLRMRGARFVAVVGDLNQGPTAEGGVAPTLEALYDPDLALVDAYSLAVFDVGPRPGSWQTCSLRNRLDYLFLSPELAARATAGGVFREGLWGAPTTKRRPPWPIFPEITSARHAASDHGAIWVDVDLP